MKDNKWNLFAVCYADGDGTTNQDTSNQGTTNQSNNSPPPKSFTQDEVNAMVAREKEAYRVKASAIQAEMKKLSETVSMSESQRKEFQQKNAELEAQFMSKAELAERERKALETQLSTERDTFKTQAEAWKTKYEKSMIQRELTDAAIANDVYEPSQIVALLMPNTKIVEEEGDSKIQIQFDDVGTDGKPKRMLYTPSQMLKRMSELKQYGNLFKTNVKHGHGLGNTSNGNGTETAQQAFERVKAENAKRGR